jgi:hypothetical protein
MGHSILIGWYSPTSKRFCYKDEKELRPEFHKSKILPVYAVLEEGMRKNLEAENKKLREVIKAALRISDLWTLKEVESIFEIEEIQSNRAVDLLAENKRLKGIIIEAKICAATLCLAGLPSLKGLKEIASILNRGINKDDIKKALS